MPDSIDKVDLKIRLKIRKDIASNWTIANPILYDGEIGIEVDPLITDVQRDSTSIKIKIGDGVTAWNDLSYSLNTVALNKALDALNLSISETETTLDNKISELNNETVKLNPTTKGQTIAKDVTVGGEFTVDGITTLNDTLVINSGITTETLTVQDSLLTNENSVTTLNGNTTIVNAEITNLNTGAGSTIDGVQIANIEEVNTVQINLDNEINRATTEEGKIRSDLANEIVAAIEELDKEDTSEAGKYVSAVTETNGVIEISRASITTGTAEGTINVGGSDIKVKDIEGAAYKTVDYFDDQIAQISTNLSTVVSNLSTEILTRETTDNEINDRITALDNATIKNTGSQVITGDLTTKKEGESTGNLVVQGNLTVAGTTTTKNTESLVVKDNMIVTNGDNTELTNLSGFAIKTGVWLDPTTKTEVPAGTADAIAEAYAIALDPSDKGGSVNLGLGSLSTDNEFTFDSDGGKPVATRVSSDQFGAGEIIVWNSDDRYDLVGSDRTLADLDTSIADAKKAGTDAQTDLNTFKTTVSDTYSTKTELTTATSGTLKIKYPTTAGSSESTEVIYTPNTSATVEIPAVAGPTGPQGDQGIQGLMGPTGPQGVAGPIRTLTLQLPTSTGFVDNIFDSSADKVIVIKIDDGILE